jgi:hypothetical protein
MSIEKKLLSRARLLRAPSLHSLKRAGLLPVLLSAALLGGCARRYDVALTNGERITNVTRPVLDKENGVFNYKDVTGEEHHINAGRVVEIGPHSNKGTTPGTPQFQKGSQ